MKDSELEISSSDYFNLHDIPGGARVALYGTGQGGEDARTLLAEMRPDIKVVAYVDTFATGEKEGLPILSPEDLTRNNQIDLVLVCSAYHAEIVGLLKWLRIKGYRVFNPNAFVSMSRPVDQAGLLENSKYTCSVQYVFTGGKVREVCERFLSILSGCSDSVALVGNHAIIPVVAHLLSAELGPSRVEACCNFNDMFKLRGRRDIQTVIMLCDGDAFVSYLRGVVFGIPFKGRIVLPSSENAVREEIHFEDPTPIVVCAFPCAGTGRFIPSFQHLLELCGWSLMLCAPFIRNLHVVSSSKERGADQPSIAEATDAVYWHGRALDHHICMVTHEWLLVERLGSLNCNVVVLMRDPRDIVNSFYWRTVGKSEVGGEEHLLRIIKGYVRFNDAERAYAGRWPDAGIIVRTYVDALDAHNTHIVRFEEMDDVDGRHLRRLMASLGIDGNPLFELDDACYRHAAHLGSFEYQTNGLRKRGEDHQGGLGGEASGLALRKGISGDWRSSFTPAAVDLFKAYAGDGLIRLGYETDHDWGI